MKLLTTDSQFQSLLGAYHAKRRKNSTTIAVDPESLGNLLKDHGTLLDAATGPAVRNDGRPVGKGHKVEAGADQESLS
jgi:hypothetical protein